MKLLQDPVERLLYFSLVVLFVAGGLGIAIIAIELNTLNQLSMSIKQQAEVVERHTDCVALLLSQPNRVANPVRIQDLTNCKIGP